MRKKYECLGETFYLQRAPNGYLVVSHRGPIGSEGSALVGYVGAREDGTPNHPHGWVTPKEFPTDRHTHRGLAYSHVADPPTVEGQLDALCQHFLEELDREREAELNRQQFNQHNARESIDGFINSLPDA